MTSLLSWRLSRTPLATMASSLLLRSLYSAPALQRVPARASPRPFQAPRQTCRKLTRCQAEMDPMDALRRSAVFNSEVVQQEFAKLMNDLASLRSISTKFPEFDLEGKRIYLDQMEQAAERYELFVKRMELSSDPAAKEYLRTTNAQMLNAGFSLQMMFDGLKQTIGMYRKSVEAEEQAIADPILHQKFKQELRAAWSTSGVNFMDITDVDPMKVYQAQKDPQFWKAIKEVKMDPSRMAYWAQDPNIGPLIKEMLAHYQKQAGL